MYQVPKMSISVRIKPNPADAIYVPKHSFKLESIAGVTTF